MADNPPNHIQQIVKVAEVRKQRLANAATAARRQHSDAEAERSRTELKLREAEKILRDASKLLLIDGPSEQLLIWREHCATRKDDSIAQHGQSEELCVKARAHLSQSLTALQRQDLRHDRLAEEERLQRLKHARLRETRIDDDLQGCGNRQTTDFILVRKS